MKKMLIFCNLILAGVVVIIVLANMSKSVKNDSKAAERPRNTAKSTAKSKKSDSAATESSVPAALPESDAACSMVISNDVFNQVRSPLANTRMGRADMTLVGVVDGRAAIIKSNTRQQQFNPYLAQAQMMSANMSGRGFHRWSQMSGRRNTGPAQQYVRIDQTMNNGFTLVEVTRTRAVLVRGNDRVELDLQLPSKNRSASRAPQRLNQTQQFQQAQMYMQSQMIRTMREIQQNSRSGAQGNRNRR